MPKATEYDELIRAADPLAGQRSDAEIDAAFARVLRTLPAVERPSAADEHVLSGVAMPERPRLEAITARGRARRRHRLSRAAGLSVAGVAAGTAVAFGLTGAHGPAPVHGTIRTLAPGTIRTAAFKIVKKSNGNATLTLNPNEFLDPATLQSDLAKYGIPAKVTSGSFCISDPAPVGFSQVVTLPPREAPVPPQSGMPPTITFDPAAMPADTELSVGYFQLTSGEQQVLLRADRRQLLLVHEHPPWPRRPSRSLAAAIRRPAGPRRALINNSPTARACPAHTPRARAWGSSRDRTDIEYWSDDQRRTGGGPVLAAVEEGYREKPRSAG